MTARTSMAFIIVFFFCGIFYFSEDYFAQSIGNIIDEWIFYILLIPFFCSFIFGIASAMITLSVRNSKNDKADIEYCRANPIIWFLVWREIREEIDRG
ncbi:hypothetical protein RHSP_79356 [Rhizobium freirei PRF 81]|uniref:Transmembrane protein n=1 Tax=Rhizobium freirei PRF 81 TaxID=363754 RepID=N6V5T9_9HYPH|nr:hypothetical protein [Rhizobium freirei]ENN86427.1 hypothetical protein RHSP_79356 [Rhizobium freirei PRF 81]